VYERRNYQLVVDIMECFTRGGKDCGIKVEEPVWIELEKETDKIDLEEQLIDFMC
jgi:hypothetical protein